MRRESSQQNAVKPSGYADQHDLIGGPRTRVKADVMTKEALSRAGHEVNPGNKRDPDAFRDKIRAM
jgi:hypothetical protein